MKYSARQIRWFLKCWPPFIGAAVQVKQLSDDFRYARVEMPLRWYNANIVRTHFGGSLYAMTDPFFMVLSMKYFAQTHYVWDKAAEIEFVAPGRKRVIAEFVLKDEDIAAIQQHTLTGQKYLHTFYNEIRDIDGELIARVKKIVYFRLKPTQRVGVTDASA